MSRLAVQSKVDYFFHYKEESFHCKGSSEISAAFMLGYVSNIMKLPEDKVFWLYSEGKKINSTELMGKYATKKILIMEE